LQLCLVGLCRRLILSSRLTAEGSIDALTFLVYAAAGRLPHQTPTGQDADSLTLTAPAEAAQELARKALDDILSSAKTYVVPLLLVCTYYLCTKLPLTRNQGSPSSATTAARSVGYITLVLNRLLAEVGPACLLRALLATNCKLQRLLFTCLRLIPSHDKVVVEQALGLLRAIAWLAAGTDDACSTDLQPPAQARLREYKRIMSTLLGGELSYVTAQLAFFAAFTDFEPFPSPFRLPGAGDTIGELELFLAEWRPWNLGGPTSASAQEVTAISRPQSHSRQPSIHTPSSLPAFASRLVAHCFALEVYLGTDRYENLGASRERSTRFERCFPGASWRTGYRAVELEKNEAARSRYGVYYQYLTEAFVYDLAMCLPLSLASFLYEKTREVALRLSGQDCWLKERMANYSSLLLMRLLRDRIERACLLQRHSEGEEASSPEALLSRAQSMEDAYTFDLKANYLELYALVGTSSPKALSNHCLYYLCDCIAASSVPLAQELIQQLNAQRHTRASSQLLKGIARSGNILEIVTEERLKLSTPERASQIGLVVPDSFDTRLAFRDVFQQLRQYAQEYHYLTYVDATSDFFRNITGVIPMLKIPFASLGDMVRLAAVEMLHHGGFLSVEPKQVPFSAVPVGSGCTLRDPASLTFEEVYRHDSLSEVREYFNEHPTTRPAPSLYAACEIPAAYTQMLGACGEADDDSSTGSAQLSIATLAGGPGPSSSALAIWPHPPPHPQGPGPQRGAPTPMLLSRLQGSQGSQGLQRSYGSHGSQDFHELQRIANGPSSVRTPGFPTDDLGMASLPLEPTLEPQQSDRPSMSTVDSRDQLQESELPEAGAPSQSDSYQPSEPAFGNGATLLSPDGSHKRTSSHATGLDTGMFGVTAGLAAGLAASPAAPLTAKNIGLHNNGVGYFHISVLDMESLALRYYRPSPEFTALLLGKALTVLSVYQQSQQEDSFFTESVYPRLLLFLVRIFENFPVCKTVELGLELLERYLTDESLVVRTRSATLAFQWLQVCSHIVLQGPYGRAALAEADPELSHLAATINYLNPVFAPIRYTGPPGLLAIPVEFCASVCCGGRFEVLHSLLTFEAVCRFVAATHPSDFLVDGFAGKAEQLGGGYPLVSSTEGSPSDSTDSSSSPPAISPSQFRAASQEGTGASCIGPPLVRRTIRPRLPDYVSLGFLKEVELVNNAHTIHETIHLLTDRLTEGSVDPFINLYFAVASSLKSQWLPVSGEVLSCLSNTIVERLGDAPSLTRSFCQHVFQLVEDKDEPTCAALIGSLLPFSARHPGVVVDIIEELMDKTKLPAYCGGTSAHYLRYLVRPSTGQSSPTEDDPALVACRIFDLCAHRFGEDAFALVKGVLSRQDDAASSFLTPTSSQSDGLGATLPSTTPPSAKLSDQRDSLIQLTRKGEILLELIKVACTEQDGRFLLHYIQNSPNSAYSLVFVAVVTLFLLYVTERLVEADRHVDQHVRTLGQLLSYTFMAPFAQSQGTESEYAQGMGSIEKIVSSWREFWGSSTGISTLLELASRSIQECGRGPGAFISSFGTLASAGKQRSANEIRHALRVLLFLLAAGSLAEPPAESQAFRAEERSEWDLSAFAGLVCSGIPEAKVGGLESLYSDISAPDRALFAVCGLSYCKAGWISSTEESTSQAKSLFEEFVGSALRGVDAQALVGDSSRPDRAGLFALLLKYAYADKEIESSIGQPFIAHTAILATECLARHTVLFCLSPEEYRATVSRICRDKLLWSSTKRKQSLLIASRCLEALNSSTIGANKASPKGWREVLANIYPLVYCLATGEVSRHVPQAKECVEQIRLALSIPDQPLVYAPARASDDQITALLDEFLSGFSKEEAGEDGEATDSVALRPESLLCTLLGEILQNVRDEGSQVPLLASALLMQLGARYPPLSPVCIESLLRYVSSTMPGGSEATYAIMGHLARLVN